MRLRIGLILGCLLGLLLWFWGRQAPAPKVLKGSKRGTLSKIQDRPASRQLLSPRPSQAPAAGKAAAAGHRNSTRICVQDANGDAVAQLSLVLYCSDTSAPLPGGLLSTDEEGCTQAPLCADPEVLTCARLVDSQHRPAKAWVLDSQAASNAFSLASPALVRGRLVDPSGRGLEGAQLWFEAEDPDRWSAPPFVQMRTRSDAQGDFRFVAARPLPCDPCVRNEEDCALQRRVDERDAPRTGMIWIRHAGHGLLSVPMAEHWGSMDSVVMDGRPAQLQGHVSGDGASRAKLMLRHREHRLDRQVIKADAQGAFAFYGLGSGSYELSIFVDGELLRKESPVQKGDDLELGLPARGK